MPGVRSRARKFQLSPTKQSIRSLEPECLKVTPAHDTLDFEIGQRHDLPIIDVLDS